MPVRLDKIESDMFLDGCPLFPHSGRRSRLSLAICDAMIYIVQGCDFQPSMLANDQRREQLHRSCDAFAGSCSTSSYPWGLEV